jgi:RNA polymerase sigma-70 factor (ECF subfamily)
MHGASRSRGVCLDLPTPTSTATDAERLQIAHRYALALTHHSQDAEDLVQDAWMNLCRRYGSVTSTGLLFTAVRHLFIDRCRRSKIVQWESLDAPEPPALPAATTDEAGVTGDLAVLLGVLRPIEREAIFLHYYEGRTAEEIGQLTGQPRGTVLSLLHRAVAKLRAAAEAEPPGPRCNQWPHLFALFG